VVILRWVDVFKTARILCDLKVFGNVPLYEQTTTGDVFFIGGQCCEFTSVI